MAEIDQSNDRCSLSFVSFSPSFPLQPPHLEPRRLGGQQKIDPRGARSGDGLARGAVEGAVALRPGGAEGDDEGRWSLMLMTIRRRWAAGSLFWGRHRAEQGKKIETSLWGRAPRRDQQRAPLACDPKRRE